MTAWAYSKLIIAFILGLVFLFLPISALAQEFSDGQIATNVEVTDTGAGVGDILSITGDDTLVRSTSEYDQKIFGVIVENPAVVLNKGTSRTKPILSEGEAQVKGSTAGGNIEVGDLITTSAESGIGQKASKEGMVVGKALASFSESSTVTIPVLINIHYQ